MPGVSMRVVAGFWEKAGAWAVPRDAKGEGYFHLAKRRPAEIGFCMLFVFSSSWGQTFLLSIFQPYWREEIGLSASEMGSLYGIATLASGLLLPVAGRWLDNALSGRAAVAACLGLTLAALFAGISTTVFTLGIALFMLRFFGQGLSTNVGMTRAARWFDHNRGKAVSLAGLGFPLSEAILPFAVTLLVATIGWRWSWGVLGAVSLVGILPLSLALLARRRALHGITPHSEDTAPRTDGASRSRLLHEWRFYAMLIITAPIPFVGTGVIFFQGTIAETRGWSAAVFPTGFLVFAAVRALCSLSFGAWVDRIGALKLLIVPSVMFAIGLIFLAQPSALVAYGFFAFLGISFGASSGVMTVAWAEQFGSERIGLIRGLSSSVAVFVSALAPIAFGFVFEAGVSIEAIMWTSSILMVAVTVPVALALWSAASRGTNATGEE